MKYNIDYSIAGILNFLILSLVLRIQYKDRTKTVRMAERIVLCLLLADLFDIVTAISISYSTAFPVWANYLLNVILYELEVVCVALLPLYINLVLKRESKNTHRHSIFNVTILILYAVMCLSTPVTHCMFFFDSDKVFHIGPLHFVESIVPLYFFAFAFVKLLINRKLFTGHQMSSIVIFILLCVTGAVIQSFLLTRTLISYFADSVAAFFIILGLETPDFTKLTNTLIELEENKRLLEIAKSRDEEITRSIHEMTKSASWSLYIGNNNELIKADWSDEFFWMLGYEKSEVAGRIETLWNESLHPDEEEDVMKAFSNGLIGIETYNVNYRLRSKNGEYRWYHGTGEVKPDAESGGLVYRGIIRDINDEMIKEELTREKLAAMDELEKSQIALKEALSKAEAADRAKSDFLANMSHEIRTPINAVLGMNELIGRESSEQSIKEYSSVVATAGQALLSLINDILDFSKIEAGKMEIVPAEYSIQDLVRELHNMINIRCIDKGLKFNVSIDSDIPRRLHGDEVRIRQVLINFLTNAVKYTDSGSVSLDLRYERTGEDTINLIAVVKDTGMGIKEEDMSLLFTSFKRIDLKSNRKKEGTGLGLSITKSFVELMGGIIDVKSTYGVGSVFTVTLPQKIIDDIPVGSFNISVASVRRKYEPSFYAPDARILVVDDVETNLVVMKGLLKQTKMHIETVNSGKKCLEMLKSTKYDIVFLDHMMPEMDGVETLEKIRADKSSLNAETPIIMLTANAILGVKEEYFGMGFTDYLSKPVKADELESMVVKHLQKEIVNKVH